MANVTTEGTKELKLVTLCKLIIFNRRRSGEVARLTKTIWHNRDDFKKGIKEDLKKNELSATEKELVKRLDLVYVMGKGRRYVPILFPPITITAIKIILEQENESKNPFIFSNRSNQFLRGHDAVRNIVRNSGVCDPAKICGTSIRKMTSTLLQVNQN